MALIEYTALVNAIRGKYNGTVFKMGAGGGKGTLHPKPISAHSKLTKADAGRLANVKSYVTRVSQAWRGLTSGQRAAWQSKASTIPQINKFGNSVYLSGFQFFNKRNLALLCNGMGQRDDCLAEDTMPAGYVPNASYTIGGAAFLLVSNIDPLATFQVSIYAGAQRPPNAAIRTKNLKWMKTGTIDSSADIDFYAEYQAAFGVVQDGNFIDVWVYVYSSLTGQVSNAYYIATEVFA